MRYYTRYMNRVVVTSKEKKLKDWMTVRFIGGEFVTNYPII